MRGPVSLLAVMLMLAGCTSGGPPSLGQLPPDAFGIGVDNDIGAIDLAQWAFADPARIRNDPVDAARAAAAVDYLADELSANPRWVGMSPITKLQMRQARSEVRQVLGIPADVPSPVVTDALLGAANALQARDPGSALAALRGGAFTLGPERTLARLSDLPFLRMANIATQRAALQRFRPDCPTCR